MRTIPYKGERGSPVLTMRMTPEIDYSHEFIVKSEYVAFILVFFE